MVNPGEGVLVQGVHVKLGQHAPGLGRLGLVMVFWRLEDALAREGGESFGLPPAPEHLIEEI